MYSSGVHQPDHSLPVRQARSHSVCGRYSPSVEQRALLSSHWLAEKFKSLGREGNTSEGELIEDTAVRMDQTPFDITNHSDLSSFAEESEGSLGTLELASLLVRTVTVVLTLLGGILLVAKIMRRRRGSSTEASLVITIQFIWQVRPLLSDE